MRVRSATRAQSAIVGRSVGNACPDAIVFFVFLRPPEGRKNPGWSELIKYLIDYSDWLVICHSRIWLSSSILSIYIQHGGRIRR